MYGRRCIKSLSGVSLRLCLYIKGVYESDNESVTETL